MRTDSDDDKVKVNRPDTYHEDRNKLDSWLTRVDVYLAFNRVPKGKRALFASTFLRDRTEAWLKPQLREYLDDDGGNTRVSASCDKLCNELWRNATQCPMEGLAPMEYVEEAIAHKGPAPLELDLTERCKGKNPRVKQGNRKRACSTCDRISHFAKDCPKGLVFQRQINATLRKIPEAEMEWEETPGISSDEEDYCLVDNPNKVLTVLEETALQATASTEPLNSNRNTVVIKLPETYPLQYQTEDSELEEESYQIKKLDSGRTVYEQITDNLERILGSNASAEREIPTRRLEDLLDLTVCDDCPYMSYRTCTNWKCGEHILEEVAKRRINNNHGALDWSLCEEDDCQIHQGARNMSTLTRLGRRYLWLQQEVLNRGSGKDETFR